MKGLLSRLIILSFSILFISPTTSRKVKANNSRTDPFFENNQQLNKTKLGVASEIIGEIATPLFSSYGLYKFISGS